MSIIFKALPSYYQGQDLIVANLGDSRAVLGTRDQNGRLVAHQLTVDLKPDHPSNSLSLSLSHFQKFKYVCSVSFSVPVV